MSDLEWNGKKSHSNDSLFLFSLFLSLAAAGRGDVVWKWKKKKRVGVYLFFFSSLVLSLSTTCVHVCIGDLPASASLPPSSPQSRSPSSRQRHSGQGEHVPLRPTQHIARLFFPIRRRRSSSSSFRFVGKCHKTNVINGGRGGRSLLLPPFSFSPRW